MKRLTLFLLLLVAPAVPAATELVLQDGQVLRGTDVRREEDVYVVELDSGGVLTIPVALVHQVRLVQDREEASPSWNGLTAGEPRQLAGEPVEPLTTNEAQAVLGEPARFRPNIIDPNWKPQSGFPDEDVLAGSRSTFQKGVVDSTWKPQSGFPDEDVLAGSRSTFQKSIIDNTWKPEDGFRRKKTFWSPSQGQPASGGVQKRLTGVLTLSDTRTPTRADAEWADVLDRGGWFRPSVFEEGNGVRFRFKLESKAAPPRSAIVRSCAGEIFGNPQAPAAVETEKVDEARYAELPIDLFRSTVTGPGGEQRAVFTVAGDECRAISGDLTDLLGVKLGREHTQARGVQAYNAALGDRIAVEMPSDEAKIDYAFAVVSLVDPDVTGHERASLLLLPDRDALRELLAREPDHCSAAGPARKKAAKEATKRFAPPSVVDGPQGELVEFFTWSSLDGAIVRHAAWLSPDGKISLDREVVATHLGEHRDRD